MGLDLRTTGRAAKPVSAEFERELDLDDILSLQEERGVKAPPVREFRERHHALARLIAEGKKPGEAAILMRYTQSRMSVLLDDPAFKELVEHYRGLVQEQFVDFQRKLAEVSTDALHLLQERLEDKGDEVSDAMLLRIVEVGADRTGHGPSQKSEVNIKIGLAERLQQARQRSQAAKLKDVTPSEGEDGTAQSN